MKFGGKLAKTLEEGDNQGREEHEDVEEGQSCHEEVRRLDAGAIGNSLNPVNYVAAEKGLDICSLGEEPCRMSDQGTRKYRGGSSDKAEPRRECGQRALHFLDLN